MRSLKLSFQLRTQNYDYTPIPNSHKYIESLGKMVRQSNMISAVYYRIKRNSKLLHRITLHSVENQVIRPNYPKIMFMAPPPFLTTFHHQYTKTRKIDYFKAAASSNKLQIPIIPGKMYLVYMLEILVPYFPAMKSHLRQRRNPILSC